jgi:pyruvate formate lyase activating enzyme
MTGPRGEVFEIQRWCTDDGPGIRTTVFFRGCPLRCAWCCNPESWSGSGADAVGVDEVAAAAARDRVFQRRSGGGVSFSGGEPTAQPAFLRALAERLHGQGVSLVLETCGWFDWAANAAALALMDRVYCDLKHMDSVAHARLTGRPNEAILANAQRLADAGVPLVLRVPLVPGANDDPANLAAVADFAADHLGGPELEVMPYHTLGLGKYRELGLAPPMEGTEPPTAEHLEAACRILAGRGGSVAQRSDPFGSKGKKDSPTRPGGESCSPPENGYRPRR